MEDTPRAEELTAEKEAEAMADDASQAARDKTTEAEATANDASLSAKTSTSSVEADRASGKAAYEALARASSSGNKEQAIVNVQQPAVKLRALPRPKVSAAEPSKIAAASAGAALEARDPHLLMMVADRMISSADLFATNAKTNATMMKGTAQITVFTLAFFAYISHRSPRAL